MAFDTDPPSRDDDPMADLLTVDQAATLLRCGRSSAYRLIAEGKLPTIWHRGRHWVHRDAIPEYLNGQRAEGARRANKLAATLRDQAKRRGTPRRKRTRQRPADEDQTNDSEADVA